MKDTVLHHVNMKYIYKLNVHNSWIHTSYKIFTHTYIQSIYAALTKDYKSLTQTHTNYGPNCWEKDAEQHPICIFPHRFCCIRVSLMQAIYFFYCGNNSHAYLFYYVKHEDFYIDLLHSLPHTSSFSHSIRRLPVPAPKHSSLYIYNS